MWPRLSYALSDTSVFFLLITLDGSVQELYIVRFRFVPIKFLLMTLTSSVRQEHLNFLLLELLCLVSNHVI